MNWIVIILLLVTIAAKAQNVLENSSFEAGFGRGWGRKADTDGSSRPFTITNDLVGGAYHGNSALRLWFAHDESLGVGQRLISQCYRLTPNTSYTFSFYAKASRTGLQVEAGAFNSFQNTDDYGFPGDEHDMAHTLVGTDWSRFTLTFTTADSTNCSYHVWVDPYNITYPTEYMLVDALQLEPSSSATDYVPRRNIELTMSCTNTVGNVFTETNPIVEARLYNYTASSSNETVNLLAWDYWNRLVLSNRFSLSVGAGLTITNLPLSSLTNWGAYRIQAWLSGIDTSDEIVTSVVPTPDNTGIDTNSTIGTDVSLSDYWLELCKLGGVKWTVNLSSDQSFRWRQNVEKTQGVYTFYDDAIAKASQHGVNILGSVAYTDTPVFDAFPTWYHWKEFDTLTFNENGASADTITKTTGASFAAMFQPDDVIGVVRDNGSAFANNGVYVLSAVTENTLTLVSTNDVDDGNLTCTNCHIVVLDSIGGTNRGYTAYVKALADHHGAVGQTNTVSAWEIGSEPDTEEKLGLAPTVVAYMIKRASEILKAANPNATIVAPAAFSPTFIQSVFAASGTNAIDAISSHIFSGSEWGAERLVTNALRVFNKPGYMTQYGDRSVTFYRTLFTEDHWPVSEKFDPSVGGDWRWKTEAVLRNYAWDIGWGFSKYFYYDSRRTTSPSYTVTYSLFEWDGSLRPKGVAWAVLAKLMDYYQGQGPLRGSWDTNYDVMLFSRSNQWAAIASVNGRTNLLATISSTEGTVTAYDAMGKKKTLPTYLTGSPLYIFAPGSMASNTFAESLSLVPASDTTPPNLSIVTFPVERPKTGSSTTIRWYALDDETSKGYADIQCAYRFNNSQWTPWTGSNWTASVTTVIGLNSFAVAARDAAGNATTNSYSFESFENKYPTASAATVRAGKVYSGP